MFAKIIYFYKFGCIHEQYFLIQNEFLYTKKFYISK